MNTIWEGLVDWKQALMCLEETPKELDEDHCLDEIIYNLDPWTTL